MPASFCFSFSFSHVRESGTYYVDKTGFLEDFLKKPAPVTVFTRPRQFGKSFFLTMLKAFFDREKDSRALFAGLRIADNEQLCREWMNRLPVVSFSFFSVNGRSFEDALARFAFDLQFLCSDHSDLLNSPAVDKGTQRALVHILDRDKLDTEVLAGSLATLCRALHAHCGVPPVVLIDEYDVPVAKGGRNGYYPEMNAFMRRFWKESLFENKHMHFAVLTGSLPFSKQTLPDNVCPPDSQDVASSCSMESIGFTQSEVDIILKEAELAHRREDIRALFGGYRFGRFGESEEIYCPWCLTTFVDKWQDKDRYRIGDSWMFSSENALFKQLCAQNPEQQKLCSLLEGLLHGESVPVQLNPAPDYDGMEATQDNILSVLYQTGYLTRVPGKEAETALLRVPNLEVARCLEEDLMRWACGRKVWDFRNTGNNLSRGLFGLLAPQGDGPARKD